LAQQDPQDAEVRLFLGDVLISAGRPEEALKWLAPLAEGPARDGRVFYLAALAYDQLGNGELALLHYEKALECEPTNEVYLASYEKALEAFPTALIGSHR
jgi:Flp pilus assembly protein TadD